MFDIHKVKPVHGWREFVGEVGIIVLGVLIALSAEALVERWHWHEQVDQSRDAIKEELFAAAMNAVERLAVAPCLRARLSDLSHGLQINNGPWTGSPMFRRHLQDADELDYVVMPAYAPPSREHLTDAWKNALSGGSFDHFSKNEAQRLSLLFNYVDQLDAFQTQEAQAATKLSPLSYNRTLTDRDRSDALASVAEVDRAMTLINVVSGQMLAQIRHLHLNFDHSRTERQERYLLGGQYKYRGNCVSTKLVDIN